MAFYFKYFFDILFAYFPVGGLECSLHSF